MGLIRDRQDLTLDIVVGHASSSTAKRLDGFTMHAATVSRRHPSRVNQRSGTRRLSFRLSFHLPLLRPTGAHWLDDSSDLTCKHSIQHYSVDDPRLSCKQQVGGSSPPARRPNQTAYAA